MLRLSKYSVPFFRNLVDSLRLRVLRVLRGEPLLKVEERFFSGCQGPSEINDHFFNIVEGVPARRAAEVGCDDDVGEFDERVAGIARLFVKGVEPVTAQVTGS